MRTRLKKWADVSPRVSRSLVLAAIAAALAFVVWLAWQYVELSVAQRSNTATLSRQQEALDDSQRINARQDEALDLANQKLVSVGEQPVPVPPVPQGIPGRPGTNGSDGVNGLSAYELWLSQGHRGTLAQFLLSLQGPRGATGATGPTGADSTTPGPAGADSTVPGPTGPAGPAGPAGKDGTNGTNGTDGAPGRGIDSLMCGTDGRWTVTYTDGTTADAGRCRSGLLD